MKINADAVNVFRLPDPPKLSEQLVEQLRSFLSEMRGRPGAMLLMSPQGLQNLQKQVVRP